ncbi:Origin recognition complex subunit 2 [Malassezia sp. CBS 17886]|nr:Origin recognition complex subunit 2 [Malassezia sp. CBS 17886]
MASSAPCADAGTGDGALAAHSPRADAPTGASTPQDTSAAPTPPHAAPARAYEAMSFVRPTSSDAWFLSNSHRRNFASRKLGRDLLRGTSGKRISDSLGALDAAELPRVALASAQMAEGGGLDAPEAERGAHAQDAPRSTHKASPHAALALGLQLDPQRISMLTSQLLSGFHLMLYGVGDKQPMLRRIVDTAAHTHAGTAVVVQGAAGRAVNADRLLDAIEAALQLHCATDPPFRTVNEHPRARPASHTARRVRRIARFLEHVAVHGCATHPRRLFIGLAAFDAPLVHTTRLHTVVHALAQCRRVHLVASVSHVNAGLLLDGTHGAFSHGIAGHVEDECLQVHCDGGLPRHLHAPSVRRRLRAPWLWHHATTFLPPVVELLQARGATIASASSMQFSGLSALRLPAALDLGGGRARAAGAVAAVDGAVHTVSDTAAAQVLSTITTRARDLFALLVRLQQGAAEGANTEDIAPRTPYATLVRDAQRQLIASSDQGVKHLLVEMVDHGLVVVWRGAATVASSHAIAVGDELSVPLSQEKLGALIGGDGAGG